VEFRAEGCPYDELSPYLAERPSRPDFTLPIKGLCERHRKGLRPTQPQPDAPSQAGDHRRTSPLFARMVPLPPGQVAGALDAWWRSDARAGVVTLRRRFEFGPPLGDPSRGWKITGRLRRMTRFHWVPVALELSSSHAYCTRITMVPQSRVLPSRRYFRVGNSALDQFLIELAVHHGLVRATPALAKRATSPGVKPSSESICSPCWPWNHG
jgi:hypothetical protein